MIIYRNVEVTHDTHYRDRMCIAESAANVVARGSRRNWLVVVILVLGLHLYLVTMGVVTVSLQNSNRDWVAQGC